MSSTSITIKIGKKRIRFSIVSVLHHFRLIYRSILLIVSIGLYISSRLNENIFSYQALSENPILLIIWVVFMFEMLLRFFPSKFESPGCQKQFKKNYIPTGRVDVKLHDNNAAMIVVLLWVLLNGIIAALHMVNILDDGIMILICLVYSVCDTICILFFCPIQTFFLKNRCCSSCRIYNWDYLMMFTPLFFIPGAFTWTLLGLALMLLIRWEITIWLYPERFSENSNRYLSCENCTEKLCSHKKQLRKFRIDLIHFAEKQSERILSGKRK